MALSPRLFAFAAGGVAPVLLLQGCGGDETGARTTLGTVQNTSYVVEPPITTTSTTTAPVAPGGGEVSPTEQIHIVVAGDNLSKIANMYGTEMETIVNYNGWTDGIGHLLLPGAEVRIPPNLQVPAATPDPGGEVASGTGGSTETAETEAPSGVGCTHTVVANDNPTRLADKYGVTLDELSNANVGNSAYTRFLIGDTINIPPNGDC